MKFRMKEFSLNCQNEPGARKGSLRRREREVHGVPYCFCRKVPVSSAKP